MIDNPVWLSRRRILEGGYERVQGPSSDSKSLSFTRESEKWGCERSLNAGARPTGSIDFPRQPLTPGPDAADCWARNVPPTRIILLLQIAKWLGSTLKSALLLASLPRQDLVSQAPARTSRRERRVAKQKPPFTISEPLFRSVESSLRFLRRVHRPTA